MSYSVALVEHRQEIRYGASVDYVTFRPHVSGIGRVAVVGTPTWIAYSPSGTSIASGTTSVTADGSYSTVLATLAPSNTTTWFRAENYRLDITWAFGGVTYLTPVYFDVVRSPVRDAFGIGLDSFREEVSDAAERLLRQADAVTDGRTAEQHSSVLAQKAWSDVRVWLRAAADASGDVFARLVVHRESLAPVVVARAVARMYRAEGGGPESESAALADQWDREAQARFRSLPRLSYDADDDGAADSTLPRPSSVRARRRWE